MLINFMFHSKKLLHAKIIWIKMLPSAHLILVWLHTVIPTKSHLLKYENIILSRFSWQVTSLD